MKLCGFQKTTLLNYPGHIAAVLFTGGCNFRCPFCHNRELLPADAEAVFTAEEIINVLKKRAGILEGVCITGGEPLLQPDIEDFIRSIRSLGLEIKLDTNGSRPERLKQLCEKHLLDYVAMDIKNGPTHYGETSGCPDIDLASIRESVDFLKHWDKPYEFRTTVVRELHCAQDFEEIGTWLAGASQYFLQNYVDSENVLQPGFTSCTKEELLSFAAIVKPYVKQVSLRGVD